MQHLRKFPELYGLAADSKLLVLIDFDGTITQTGTTSYSVIEQSKHIPKYARRAASVLREKYLCGPTEPSDEDVEKWYREMHYLMKKTPCIDTKFSDVVRDCDIQIRKGACELLGYCRKEKIPLVIYSSGLGEIIYEYLTSTLPYSCVPTSLVCNPLRLPDDTSVLILPHNKDKDHVQHALGGQNVFEGRDWILVIGDELGDMRMGDSFSPDRTVKVLVRDSTATEQEMEEIRANGVHILIEDGDLTCMVNQLRFNGNPKDDEGITSTDSDED